MFDHGRLRTLLPHGHPVLLVDRVSIEPDGSAVGTKAISASEPCYRHMPLLAEPEQYAYPASLLLESFGQTAAVLWLEGRKSGPVDESSLLMLAAVRNCRFEGRAYPGDVLRHVVTIDHVSGDSVFVEGETFVGEQRIAVVESMIAVVRSRAAVVKLGA
jgi:3-hydroxyacyl-[acyl-carrier-protein] dehydratase